MSRIVHVEIPTKDPDKSVDFYTKAFGWEIEKWDGPQDYWLIATGDQQAPGINGAFMRASDSWKVPTFVLDVEDVDETIRKVTENGGTVAMPKGPVPGIGWVAYFHDPSGNLFGVMQNDPNAA